MEITPAIKPNTLYFITSHKEEGAEKNNSYAMIFPAPEHLNDTLELQFKCTVIFGMGNNCKQAINLITKLGINETVNKRILTVHIELHYIITGITPNQKQLTFTHIFLLNTEKLYLAFKFHNSFPFYEGRKKTPVTLSVTGVSDYSLLNKKSIYFVQLKQYLN